MPVRFRRKRILVISIISIFIVIYLIDTHSDNPSKDEYDIVRKKDVKRFTDEIIHTTTMKSSLLSRSLREELHGEKLKKIDWHDYELIARENARIGDFHFIYLSTSYYLVFN
jgi:hypothetical protein